MYTTKIRIYKKLYILVGVDFMGKGRGRPGGNPEFGTKYKNDFGRDRPLTEQIKAVVYPETKEKLKSLADEKNCSVPDLVRAAIEQYLASMEPEKVA